MSAVSCERAPSRTTYLVGGGHSNLVHEAKTRLGQIRTSLSIFALRLAFPSITASTFAFSSSLIGSSGAGFCSVSLMF